MVVPKLICICRISLKRNRQNKLKKLSKWSWHPSFIILKICKHEKMIHANLRVNNINICCFTLEC